MKLQPPPKSPLCAAEQLDLMLAVDDRSSDLCKKTGGLLLNQDRFKEAIAEFEQIPDEDHDFNSLINWARAWIASKEHSFESHASKILARTLDLATDPEKRSHVLTEMAIVATKTKKHQEARRLLQKAMESSPANSLAFRKYTALELDEGRENELREHCERLIANGFDHSRVLAGYVACLVKLGQVEEAKNLRGLEPFLWQGKISIPDDFTTLDKFNSAMAKEILASPALRYENTKTASHNSWRVEQLNTRNVKILPQLMEQIAAQIDHYVSRLESLSEDCSEHLWVRSRPAKAQISPWSVISRAESYQNWHMHGAGWLSGVCYVTVADQSNSKAGDIEFGWPERLLGAEKVAELGTKRVTPEPGMLLLFPSHIHHRTWPHGQDGDRIVVSFDIVPQAV